MADMRPCPECGGDLWKSRDHSRVLRDLKSVRSMYEQLARENGLLLAEQRLREVEVNAQVADANRKVNRQAKAIRRLEAKLREARKRPYEGATLEETP